MDAITFAFESYDPTMLENVWGVLFSIQAYVLKHQQGNDLGVPHESGRNAVHTQTMVEMRYVNC